MNVTGCHDCPLADWGEAGDQCGHPDSWRPLEECVEGHYDAAGEYIAATYPAPSWCPLRTAPLTIALEGVPEIHSANRCHVCGGRHDGP